MYLFFINTPYIYFKVVIKTIKEFLSLNNNDETFL